MVSAFSEYAETCTAVATSGHRVCRKFPPSASSGVRVRDRVHHAVQAVHVLADPFGQGGEVVIAGHVELEDRRR